MIHTGTQEFSKITVSDTVTSNKQIIEDRLSIPTTESLEGSSYGDLFIESNYLNLVDTYNNINQVLDINNTNIIKSLLLTEHFYDNFLNFDNTTSDSFNTIIDINSNNYNQFDINETLDATTHWDNTNNSYIALLCDTIEYGENLYNLMSSYMENNTPIRTVYIDNITNYTYMFFYNYIVQDSDKKEILILFNGDNTSVFNDLTGLDIIQIKINNFIFKNDSIINNYIKLPYHYHNLIDIEDLNNNTNTENGYLKLTDNNLILPITFNIYPDNIKINNSYFENNINNSLLKNNLFNININNTLTDFNVNYTDSTIDLGGGSFIIEYYYQNTTININNNNTISTNNSQLLNFDSSYDSTINSEQSDYYLVEKIIFNKENLIISGTHQVNKIISVEYVLLDKTTIDNNEITVYDIVDSTVTIYNNYYDIQVIQSNPNTIPFVLVNNYKLYKDDYGNSLIFTPTIYELDNIANLTLDSDKFIYLTSDSTTIEFTIKYYNYMTSLYDEVYTYNNTYLNKKINLSLGRIRIEPSVNSIPYKIYVYSKY